MERGYHPSARATFQSLLAREPFNGATGDPAFFPPQLMPDLAHSLSSFASIVDALDRPEDLGVHSGLIRGLAVVAINGETTSETRQTGFTP